MRLEYIAGISLPGDPAKPNDDAFCHSPLLAAVFDGATALSEPLLPVDSDAAWIARKGAEGLIAHQGLGAREALHRAAADAEREFARLRKRPPRENHELPLASMMLAAPSHGGLQFLWFGDCAALISRPGEAVEVIGNAFASRGAESRRVARLAEAKGLTPTAGVGTPQYLEALRAARNKVNTRSDRWAFSPDAACAKFASGTTARTPTGSVVLLCTDGFLALASDYGRYNADTFLSACLSQGLKALCGELRTIEVDDSQGKRFPRFKVSDDATALLLRLEGDGE
jgi:serine/threonine protein phosphatase PrpC